MVLKHRDGWKFLSWVVVSGLKPSLRVYESIALGRYVDDGTLKRTCRRLADTLQLEMQDWGRRVPNESTEVDYDNVLHVDVRWLRGLIKSLRYARTREDMINALDSFWHNYHESFANAADDYYEDDPEAASIFRRLENLSS